MTLSTHPTHISLRRFSTWKSGGRWPRWRRVPVIRQRGGLESGVVCLAMVLAYFGRPRTLAQCCVACDAGRDGLTTEHLVDAAQALGLYAKDWVVQGADAFRDARLQLPAIVYWQDRQFVVIERITRRRVTIIDPARGRRRLARGVFDRCCSGVAVTFACGGETKSRATRIAGRFEPRRSDQAAPSNDAGRKPQGWFVPVRELLHEVWQAPDAKWIAGLLVVSTIALHICNLAVPVATLLVVDHILSLGVEPSLIWMGAAGLLVALSHTVLGFVRSQALAYLSASAEVRWGYRALSRVVRMPFHLVQRRMAADLLARIGGLDAMRGYVAVQAMVACLDGWFVISSLLLIAVWSPALAVLAGGVSLLQVCLTVGASRWLRMGIEREVAASAETEACVAEVLRGLADVKTAGCEEHAIERWSLLAGRRLEFSESRQRLGSMVEASLSGMTLCSLLGLLILGTHEVVEGRLTMGGMLALSVLAAGALIPLGEVTGRLQWFLTALARFERLREVIDVPVGVHDSGVEGSTADVVPGTLREMGGPAVALRAYFSGAIRVERLCFRYQQSGPLVLDDVSFAVGAGDLVAIVGRSGSGKSTLARLLAGLHVPSSGSVSFDRWPVPSFDRWRVGGQCGVVLQDSVLFDQTIRENIAFGRVDLSFEQIMRAAQVADVHDEIMRMPMGYDTRVFEAGSGLSGSERQRLLIARAVAHGPALVILDEAMSQLDVEVERRVASKLVEFSCTRIVIGHRVSIVRHADLVLVLDRGRIVEQGSPEMLMRHRGLFARLADEQDTWTVSSTSRGHHSRAGEDGAGGRVLGWPP